jgi:RNA recognition motif-containing protein
MASTDYPPLPDSSGVAAYSQEARNTSNPDHTVFVSGLRTVGQDSSGEEQIGEASCLERLLAELFTQFAPVCRVSIPRDRITGKPLGSYAFVEFVEAEDAAYVARVAGGILFRGRTLEVRGPQLQRDTAVAVPKNRPRRIEPS